MSDIVRLRPGDKPLLLEAFRHNRKTIVEHFARKEPPQPQNFYMGRIDADGYLLILPPGSHRLGVMRKNDDLLPAAFIGALVFDTLNGHDAVMLDGDELRPIELKLAMTDRSKYWLTPLGTVYSGKQNKKNKKNCLKSGISGSYEIKNNLEAKNVTTFLMAVDEVSYEVIDCYRMAGEVVLDRLKNNKVTKAERDKGIRKISLKLNTFMTHGERYYIEGALGVDKYEEQIQATGRVLNWDEEA